MPSPLPVVARSLDWVLAASRQDRHRRFGCRLLDARPRAAAHRSHLPGSACLPVEGSTPHDEEIPSHLLAARGREMVVVGRDAATARHIAGVLAARGFTAAYCDAPVPEESMVAGPAAGALWQPDPYLEENLAILPPPSAGPVLDLGCGSGRDGVFLAMHAYDCLLVDRQSEALAMARERARRHGVAVRTAALDLRQAQDVPAGPWAVMLSIRFLQREVLARAEELLLPASRGAGGTLVLRTFAETTADRPAPASTAVSPRRPHRPRFRLGLEELARLLPTGRWDFPRPARVVPRDADLWLEAIARRR